MTRVQPVTGRPFPSPVPPGAGWPGDPATAATPVAGDAANAALLAEHAPDLGSLDAAVSVCRACPRLVDWREQVARTPRRSFVAESYWGRPVTGWGPADARILVLGLAPAAHGGNRTGRIFTGDRSGDWLFAALHRAGLAALSTSVAAGDGQSLEVPAGPGVRITAAVHCAPPANAPTPAEVAACRPWLLAELRLLEAAAGGPAVIVTLGALAWAAALAALPALGLAVPRPRPRFGHAREVVFDRPDPPGPAVAGPDGCQPPERPLARAAARRTLTVLGCYHPSQQNTFTGVLTETMLDAVLDRAALVALTF